MHGVPHARRLWTAVWQDLATYTRAHYHLTTSANRCTHSLKKTLHAWHNTMLALRLWFQHSVAWACVAVKTQIAHPFLKLYSYAHSFLPVLLHYGQLFEINAKQARTIGGGGGGGHAAPCRDCPRDLPRLGVHGCTLHVRAQPMAVGGLPRSGGGVFGFVPQSLRKFLGGL